MINEILNRLAKVKRRGNNTWIACCPAHNDKTPSLAIALTEDGRILLKCFAGCEAIEIVHSLGLEVKDLFPKYGLNPYGTMQHLHQEYEKKSKQRNEIEHAKIVMALYETDKESGIKLSLDEKKTVMKAYQILKANNEN